MHKTIIAPYMVFLFLLCAFASSGCSLIGFCLGAAEDSKIPGTPILIPAELDSLKAGTELLIVTRDHETLRGRFASRLLVPDKLYPMRFEQWRVTLGDNSRWVPSFGTAIYVGVSTGSRQLLLNGAFAGFDTGSVRIESPPGSDAIGIRIETVDDLCDSLGRPFADRERLIRTIAAGVPVASGVGTPCIKIAGAPRSTLALDDIETISIPISGDSKWIGLIVGAAIDTVVVVVVLNIDAHLPHFRIPLKW